MKQLQDEVKETVRLSEESKADFRYAAPEDFEEGGRLFEEAKNATLESFKDEWKKYIADERSKGTAFEDLRYPKTKEYETASVLFGKYFGFGDHMAKIVDEIEAEIKTGEITTSKNETSKIEHKKIEIKNKDAVEIKNVRDEIKKTSTKKELNQENPTSEKNAGQDTVEEVDDSSTKIEMLKTELSEAYKQEITIENKLITLNRNNDGSFFLEIHEVRGGEKWAKDGDLTIEDGKLAKEVYNNVIINTFKKRASVLLRATEYIEGYRD